MSGSSSRASYDPWMRTPAPRSLSPVKRSAFASERLPMASSRCRRSLGSRIEKRRSRCSALPLHVVDLKVGQGVGAASECGGQRRWRWACVRVWMEVSAQMERNRQRRRDSRTGTGRREVDSGHVKKSFLPPYQNNRHSSTLQFS